MLSLSQLNSLYAFVTVIYRNPRISVRELHNSFSHYKNRDSTRKLLKKAYDNNIIMGPKIWCNTGFDVEIYKDLDDPLSFLEQNSKRPEITHINAFIGDISAICFKKGASVLQHAETIIPTFPAKKTIDEIQIEEKGILPSDEYPKGWDEIDWKVYKAMRVPRVPYWRVAKKVEDSLYGEERRETPPWQTVKRRFLRIVRDCKTWISFFPKGYDNYHQAYLLFKTDYEISFRDELRNVDRTSIIYKFDDNLLLHLFLDETLKKLHKCYRKFYKLKKEGIIHDLHVLIPMEWYSSF